MTYIKICGIKDKENALAIAGAGADFIGVVFANSPRQVTPAQALEVVSALKKSRAKAQVVGVFVNTPVPTARKIVDACHLDWVQLSGDESWEYCLELGRPVIKVFRVSRNYPPEQACADMDYGIKVLAGQKHIFLLDATAGDKYGGTGTPFNWELAKPIATRFQVIIAGGLSPGNVGRAIKIIKPWGVDVSSGVETKGVKNMSKVLKFIEAVREADAK
jgi:phosphoribosylanthranilate isomerase